MPMFIQPACYTAGTCTTARLNTFGFAASRIQQLGPEWASVNLSESGGEANFGTAWQHPLQVDATGSAVINYVVGPGGFQKYGQYLSFGDVYDDTFSADRVKGKVVLIGAYGLTGVHDEFLTPAGNGMPMAGVELHANVVNMFIPLQPKFPVPEAPAVLFVIMLVLAIATAAGVSRVTVLWGFVGTVGALLLFTVGMSALAVFNGWVPDLFHPWLVIALTYTGVTAYRLLYEDREKRKVTALFGQYLTPEIVAQLAKTKGGVEDILRGGERRDITLMFVDIRGFTSMSESMAARFCAHAPAFQVLIGQETYEMCKDYIAVDLVPGVQLKGKSAETFRLYQLTAIRETPDSSWVQFPTELATRSHHIYTAQYTQQTVIVAGESGSSDILVGDEARAELARRAQSPN